MKTHLRYMAFCLCGCMFLCSCTSMDRAMLRHRRELAFQMGKMTREDAIQKYGEPKQTRQVNRGEEYVYIFPLEANGRGDDILILSFDKWGYLNGWNNRTEK